MNLFDANQLHRENVKCPFTSDDDHQHQRQVNANNQNHQQRGQQEEKITKKMMKLRKRDRKSCK